MSKGKEQPIHGACVCGAVTFSIRNPDPKILVCHCRQCRRMSGHLFAATAVHWGNLEFTEQSGLEWYQSSENSSRGFCRKCGSSLFFSHGPDNPCGVSAGALEDHPGLEIAAHIYVDEDDAYMSENRDTPYYSADDWRKGGWNTYRKGGPSIF